MSWAHNRATDETPWASFSDALSGILFVFVITTFWFALRLAVETNKAQQTTKRLERDISTLKKAADEAKDLVQRRDGTFGLLASCLDGSEYLRAEPERESARVSLYLHGDDPTISVKWFEPCQATLGQRQERAAKDVRRCVEKVLQQEGDQYDVRIFLEGHTDAVAVSNCGDGLVSNWELSGARAAAVTRAVLGIGQRVDSSPLITEAVNHHRLQLLAVGLADTRPAWGALCARPARLTDLDRSICSSLSAGDAAAVSAALANPAVEACPVPQGSDSCAGSSDAARLCRWANWCADVDSTVDDRRGLLRRVDLRVELEPRIAAARAAGIAK